MARTRTQNPPQAAQEPQGGTNGPGTTTDPPEAAETGERLSDARLPDSEVEVLGEESEEAQLILAGMEEPPTIHQRMAAILAELPSIGKDTRNEQQGFMFRSHDAVLNALNPLLAKHGVYVVPHVLQRVTGERTTSRNSTMYEVNLHVQYRFIAEDGSWIDCSAWGEGTDMGDKATNKAMTMAFKNVLAQSFAVSTEEGQTYDADADSPEETTSGPAAPPAPPPAPVEERMRAKILALCEALDVQTQAEPGTWRSRTEDGILASFGSSFADANEPELAEVGKALKAIQEGGTTETPEQIDFTVPF